MTPIRRTLFPVAVIAAMVLAGSARGGEPEKKSGPRPTLKQQDTKTGSTRDSVGVKLSPGVAPPGAPASHDAFGGGATTSQNAEKLKDPSGAGSDSTLKTSPLPEKGLAPRPGDGTPVVHPGDFDRTKDIMDLARPGHGVDHKAPSKNPMGDGNPLENVKTTVKPIPPQLERLHSALLAKAQPAVRAWIGEQTVKLRHAPPAAIDEGALRAAAHARFSGSGQRDLRDLTIDELVIAVLMDAAKQNEQELKDFTAELKARNDAKQKLRELTQKAKRQEEKLRADTPGDVQTRVDDWKAERDAMSELSEERSLRLQMMIDRWSKFMQTLSNIMKKISSTQDTLLQNLK